ncbi:unnamed protein product [Effrenium voratum]|nr:unnamed protein product [Effrenium voratum]
MRPAAAAMRPLRGRAFCAGSEALYEGLRLQRQGRAAEALRRLRAAESCESPLLRAAARNAEGLLLLRSAAPVCEQTQVLHPGDVVLAPWAEDGFEYEATLERIDEANGSCIVSWADGGQTCREVPLAAVTTVQGLPCRGCSAQDLRLWASRRALTHALLEWQVQAEAGTAHDAFVDFAGLLCDLAAAEVRVALRCSWPGLELARVALQRGRYSAERAFKPDRRALAALTLARAELMRLEGASAPELLSLHRLAGEHLALATWSSEPLWRSAGGELHWQALHQVLWAKALAQLAIQAKRPSRTRRTGSKGPQRRAAQGAWSPPEKLVTAAPAFRRDPLAKLSFAPQAAGRAWRALCWAASRADSAKSAPWSYSAASCARLAKDVEPSPMGARLLLEVAVITFVMGCRCGQSRRARQAALPLALEAARRLEAQQPDDAAEVARHACEILSGQEVAKGSLPQRLRVAHDSGEAGVSGRWLVAGYLREELWLLRRGGRTGRRRAIAVLAGAPSMTWAPEGLALAETLPAPR